MEFFTYEFCKELLVYTGAAILIIGCVCWYLYLIAEILIKVGKQVVRFVKWIKTRRHPAEVIQSTNSEEES